MDHQEKLTTTVSTEGQIALPDAVRERQSWTAGTRLTVEETPEGVLLKQAPAFAPTKPEDVFGMLRHLHEGPPKTLEEMDEGILREARRSFLESVDPDA
jgi:AbrB family looped-hinge helix DNA binding protein